MEQEMITGLVVLGVLVLCIISLVVIIAKNIILKLKGEPTNRQKSKKGKKETKTKRSKMQRTLKKKKRKQKTVEKENEEDIEDRTILMDKDEVPEIDDDEATVLMRREEPAVHIQLISDTTGQILTASCVSQVLIGRRPNCDIQIVGDKSVSGNHCLIKKAEGNQLMVCDLHSSNGTYLNDSKVNMEEYIIDGDTLEIGRTRYTVHIS